MSKTREEKQRVEYDFSKARDASGDPDACFLYGEGVAVAEFPGGDLVPIPGGMPLSAKIRKN